MAIFEITIDQGSLNELNEKKTVSSEFSLAVNLSQTSLSSRNDMHPSQ